MKHTFDSTEIAHVWAHGNSTHGKSPSNLSFDGDTIFSYGTAIGWKGEHKGQTFFILNRTSYSVSTSKAQGRVGVATYGENIFRIEGVSMGTCTMPTGKELLEHNLLQAANCVALSKAPRTQQKTKDALLVRKLAYLEEAQKINLFFGLRRKINEKATDKEAAQIADAKIREEKQRKNRQDRLEATLQENLQKWLAGESVQPPYGIEKVWLRKAQDPMREGQGGNLIIETSKGALIPYDAGAKAYRFAVARKSKGWHRNGETFAVGNYQLDAINEMGIVAGCHRITWEELERFAALEGWK